MNPNDPTPANDDLREVQEAYRELPSPEPSAALDARVRAAVVAEVATAAMPKDASRRVLPFPRWRRAALPLAAAAAVLVAVGVDTWQRMPVGPEVREPQPEARRAQELPATAPASPAPQAPAVATPAPPPPRPRPPSYTPPVVATPLLDLPTVVAPPPPAAMARTAAAPATPANEASAPAPVPVPAGKGLAVGAMADAAKLEAALESAPVQALAKRTASAPPADDAAVFEEIRQLLAHQHRDEALALLKRWREAHAGVALPADLKNLETVAGH